MSVVVSAGAEAGKRILLGRIAGAHGIRGEVLIRTFAERPGDIAAYGPVDDGHGRTVEIRAARVTPAMASRGTSASVIPRKPANGRGQRILERTELFMMPLP